jgi:hypothetical protein
VEIVSRVNHLLLDIANRILLISTPDIPVKNARYFRAADALGYPQEKTIFILNKEDGRSGVNVKDIQAVSNILFAASSAKMKTATFALNHGTPFFRAARAYLQSLRTGNHQSVPSSRLQKIGNSCSSSRSGHIGANESVIRSEVKSCLY